MRGPTRSKMLVIGVLILLGAAGRLYAQEVTADSFSLHFGFDRSDLRPADTPALRLFLRDRLSGAGIDSILVTGYTDTTGSVAYNDRLSLRRANATAALLRQWKVLTAPLFVAGRGEADAFPGDDSASRRVTILVYRQPAPPPQPAPVVTPPTVVRRDSVPPASEPDTVFQLEDIRFIANTATLTDEARLVLPRYVKTLATLKDRFLEVDGYCNSPGPPLPSNDPLYILSVKRAKFIYDWLIENGFDPDKLTYKGKGNTNPRNAHPTTRGEMDQNMRVEIRVYRQKPER